MINKALLRLLFGEDIFEFFANQDLCNSLKRDNG